ncbi:YggS family pyridoxal phosphate-dependent enzyme [Moraxella sp. ZY210820]|uniref:YggS family pyridoxal phosphate-dependent enzyme n=1 Tax=unclassified Moraxella TaxID=2685852 RepID=UPI00272F2F58|nr:YggS family pyridoxal phosphate-dependent enzyme [Moraxella sp. ZY210820]WLF84780.1 YggS family pyridoxal phosphate-dependent enzyme [Moraxella sp. ZY210820]
MTQIMQSFQQVQLQIQSACVKAQRQVKDVQLLAVSKTQSADKIRELYQLGQRTFGENYVQEAMGKITELQDLAIDWHFIGHVQRNKTKLLAENFAWVQGVDKLIIAERLSKQRPSDLPALNVCIQVNIDNQDSKDGCAVDDVVELVHHISRLPNIRLRGLMVIPKPEHFAAFEMAKALFDDMVEHHAYPQDWDTLSMGMSNDLEQAIAQGSTMVRVGTALFGVRDYST